MSTVDQVVARRRLSSGPVGERKTFTLARSRAIHKMREFALADPYYYVLELIQAGVAQGSSYVRIELDDDSMSFSCTGVGFREEELSQLFDFLFTGRDRPDLGHVRELALGINALLLFAPREVVVESGDGTPEGSTRLVLTNGGEQVEVGRTDRATNGTVVRAIGLRRKAMRNRTTLGPLDGLPPEAAAIEERCLASPVPILVNDRPVFGYSSARLPALPGYGRRITVDEGDLYGTLGIQPSGFEASIKLLTYGVWIESVERMSLEGGKLVGGVICFDRLHKTVDHSGIVRDHLWEEMWARLRPYARRLVTGEEHGAEGAVTLLGGGALSVRELRPLVQGSSRVCLVPPGLDASTPPGRAARAIAEALGCPVLSAHETERSWLKALAGPATSFLPLDLSGDADMPFFTQQPPVEPPPRPWLTGEIALADLSMGELLGAMARRLCVPRLPPPLHGLEGLGPVRATVHTPETVGAPGMLRARLVTVDRVAAERALRSPYPGHVLTVHLPDMSPRILSERVSINGAPPRSVGTVLAVEMALGATPALAEASRRALGRVMGQGHREPPGPTLRAMALAALERSLVFRVSAREDGTPRLRLSVLGEGASDALLSLPIFPTLGGSWLSVRGMGKLMEAQGGLIYGVLPDVPPALEGLRSGEILSLDADTESRLLVLVGDAAYVRVDRRDVLAEHRGVLCRDLALGLRSYPDFPLLVEGVDPTGWPADERVAALESLLGQLVQCASGAGLDENEGDVGRWEVEEARRQACRHLQWFLCRRALAENEGAHIPGFGLDDLPLFLDYEDHAFSFAEVRRALAGPGGLPVALRRALGASELGLLAVAMRARGKQLEPSRDQVPRALRVSPFLCALLAPLGGARLGVDHPLPHEVSEVTEGAPGALTSDAMARSTAFLCRVEVSGDGLFGQVGIPSDPEVRPEVAVLLSGRDRLYSLPGLALRYGMTGFVRVHGGQEPDTAAIEGIESALTSAGERLLEDLLARLPELPAGGPEHLSAALRLLGFAGEHLQLLAAPDGSLRAHVSHLLAARVLDLPLFAGEDGALRSGRVLVDRFCRHGGQPLPSRVLSPEAPAELAGWIRRVLDPSHVIRPAAARPPLPASPKERADHGDDALVAAAVERWLHWLRPDLLDEGAEALGSVMSFGRTPYSVIARRKDVFSRFTGSRELLTLSFFDRVPTMILNADHWLFAHARERAAEDPTALAALLLGCYAHVNAVLDPITNTHERLFQLRLLEALEASTLGLKAQPPGESQQ